MFLVSCKKVMPKIPEHWGKLMRIANIHRAFFHTFWTTWENLLKFSEKICFMIILKVTKNQGFKLFLEDTFFEKPQVSQFEILFPLGILELVRKEWSLEKSSFFTVKLFLCVHKVIFFMTLPIFASFMTINWSFLILYVSYCSSIVKFQ